jgi:rubredoxin
MAIIRFTCTICGLVTRVEEGQDHVACAHKNGPFEVVNEDEEANPPVEE